MDFYSDKNQSLKNLKNAMVKLIDNTLCYDMEWKIDNFDEAKKEIESIKNTLEMIGFFNKVYNYVLSLEDNEEWIEAFQKFGKEELNIQFFDNLEI